MNNSDRKTASAPGNTEAVWDQYINEPAPRPAKENETDDASPDGGEDASEGVSGDGSENASHRKAAGPPPKDLRKPEYPEYADSADDDIIDPVFMKLEDIQRQLQKLDSNFQSKLKYDEHKNKLIDDLHQELQSHKEDIVKRFMRSLVMDLIQFMDSIRKLSDFHSTQNPDQLDAEKLLNLLNDIPSDLEDICERQGVTPFSRDGGDFNPGRQRALKQVETSDPEKDKTVAESLRPGYEWDDQMIRPEMVAVYTYKAPAPVEPDEVPTADEAPPEVAAPPQTDEDAPEVETGIIPLQPPDVDENPIEPGAPLETDEEEPPMETGALLHPDEDENPIEADAPLEPDEEDPPIETGALLQPDEDENPIEVGAPLQPDEDETPIETSGPPQPDEDETPMRSRLTKMRGNWMSKQIKRIFGIDLGTTYSSIACVDEYGKTIVIPNSENQRVTPSVVFFDGDNIVVGEIAKESSKLYPNEVISFVKRSMGEQNFIYEFNDRQYRAEEISSFIIRKLVQDAEQSLGISGTKDVVITCPAYFGINEREATRRAGEIAGYNVRQIINEPTAAAITYGSMETEKERVVLVYDLGGGTFDITMIEIKPHASIEVICTGGDHNLGGKDWDDRIVAHLVEEYQKATGSKEDILDDPDTCQDLQLSAEKAKKILSQRDKTPVLITHGGERVKVSLERKQFESITQDLLERTISLTHDMLNEAGKKGHDHFDDIIMVGGSTRMPLVAERIQREFSTEPRLFDPDEAVAKGAAIFGWKIFLQDEVKDKVAKKTGKSVDELDDLEDIDLKDVLGEVEEIVAQDTGFTVSDVKRSRIKIQNVTSKSFGVIAHDSNDREIVYNLILKNNDVPVNINRAFGTAVANQEAASIQIMENESGETVTQPEHAVLIGNAVLNLPTDLKENTPIEITFRLNEEGRLEITAEETSETRRSVNVTIETRSVIQGEELAEAKARARHIVVT